MTSESLHIARAELLKALANGQIRLAFQPQIDLKTGQIAGFEGVARWYHPHLGELQPGLFLGLAAREGVLSVLSRTLVGEAARMACDLRVQGYELDVALNLSTSDMTDPAFVSDAITIIGRTGAKPEWIVLEAPEEGLAFAGEAGFVGLERLKAAGFQIALDAKGPPSVALDKRARALFDQLKCGGTTMLKVASLLHTQGASAFMRRLDAAQAAELPVIAVGAESDDAIALFTQLGFSRLQGLAVSGPVSIETCLWMLDGAVANAPVPAPVSIYEEPSPDHSEISIIPPPVQMVDKKPEEVPKGLSLFWIEAEDDEQERLTA